MRRKDRELSRDEALEIIDSCEYGVISCVDDEVEIFSVPISPVRLVRAFLSTERTLVARQSCFKMGEKWSLSALALIKSRT